MDEQNPENSDSTVSPASQHQESSSPEEESKEETKKEGENQPMKNSLSKPRQIFRSSKTAICNLSIVKDLNENKISGEATDGKKRPTTGSGNAFKAMGNASGFFKVTQPQEPESAKKVR